MAAVGSTPANSVKWVHPTVPAKRSRNSLRKDRRAHLHALDVGRGNRRIPRDSKHRADTRERRVGVAPGVLGQQLVRGERAVGPARDDVGEGTATIDPEAPAGGGSHGEIQGHRIWPF